ncbi:hypothetical protein D7Y26_03360 [Stenotrophomonas maltophilia]|nr:hypothetical protein [Stenotrophomonas maltophilia]MBA0322657.1 hypothetical protein [Stenotrophomonas maltophilia]PWI04175.1 hypothetical protein DI494_01150 [Stenotrophomonas maltophilia]
MLFAFQSSLLSLFLKLSFDLPFKILQRLDRSLRAFLCQLSRCFCLRSSQFSILLDALSVFCRDDARFFFPV